MTESPCTQKGLAQQLLQSAAHHWFQPDRFGFSAYQAYGV